MKQDAIFRNLKASLVNSPPSRFKEMSSEATNGFANAELYALREKLHVIQRFIDNQLLIRKNKKEELEACSLDVGDKKKLLKALEKGQLNGALK